MKTNFINLTEICHLSSIEDMLNNDISNDSED
jgi:hypothetical protein